MQKLAEYCLENGMMLALGNSFSQSDLFQRFIRLNIAHCMQPQVFDQLEKAMRFAAIRSIE